MILESAKRKLTDPQFTWSSLSLNEICSFSSSLSSSTEFNCPLRSVTLRHKNRSRTVNEEAAVIGFPSGQKLALLCDKGASQHGGPTPCSGYDIIMTEASAWWIESELCCVNRSRALFARRVGGGGFLSVTITGTVALPDKSSPDQKVIHVFSNNWCQLFPKSTHLSLQVSTSSWSWSLLCCKTEISSFSSMTLVSKSVLDVFVRSR